MLSGEKIKTYDLNRATSVIKTNPVFLSVLYSPLVLKVLATPGNTYKITSRYGFSSATLTAVNNALNNMRTVV